MQIQEFFPAIHELWSAPALIGVALWLLYGVLEWATFIGLGAIVITVPMTGIIAGKLFGIRKEIVACADKRVNLVSEVINGMRVIKFYAWRAAPPPPAASSTAAAPPHSTLLCRG